MRTFRNGRVHLVAQAVVQSPVVVDLPGVLYVGIHIVAVDGRGTDVWAIREIRRRYGDGVSVGRAEQETAESVGQRIAGLDVVLATGRRDEGRRIYGPAAK